jgi:hypothetical protein
VIVRVHSLGSLWQTKDLPNGGSRVWNTTGIRDGCRVRSGATLFGQLVFGPKAKPLLQDPSRIHGRNWVTSDIIQTSAGRSIRLACPAASGAIADWHLHSVSERLVGVVAPDGLDPNNILVLSASQRKQQQELLLLVRPFAWLSGPTGSAIGSGSTRSGTDLVVTYDLQFKAGFTGVKDIYVQGSDIAGHLQPWKRVGGWTVP